MFSYLEEEERWSLHFLALFTCWAFWSSWQLVMHSGEESRAAGLRGSGSAEGLYENCGHFYFSIKRITNREDKIDVNEHLKRLKLESCYYIFMLTCLFMLLGCQKRFCLLGQTLFSLREITHDEIITQKNYDFLALGMLNINILSKQH